MKIVAATRLRKIEAQTLASRAYRQHIRRVLSEIAKRSSGSFHPLFSPRPQIRNCGVIIITSNKGMVGSFNTNLIRYSLDFLKNRSVEHQIIIVGKIGQRRLQAASMNLVAEYTGIERQQYQQISEQIRQKIIEMYLEEKIDEAYLIYNEFRLHLLGKVALLKLLPVEPPESSKGVEQKKPTSSTVDFLYEPSAEEVLEQLLPEYIKSQIYQILLESSASEEKARMLAMDYATQNAEEMIESLTLSFNRARQEQITKEIIEIVSATEAL